MSFCPVDPVQYAFWHAVDTRRAEIRREADPSSRFWFARPDYAGNVNFYLIAGDNQHMGTLSWTSDWQRASAAAERVLRGLAEQADRAQALAAAVAGHGGRISAYSLPRRSGSIEAMAEARREAEGER